ncbi:hypothetical protein BY996DRAFT_6410251 [Phakopsora pachyrhizi]|nr:hypothetical protein BY996DRAFT_6410251 [Phakopsora pachyrhizi]
MSDANGSTVFTTNSGAQTPPLNQTLPTSPTLIGSTKTDKAYSKALIKELKGEKKKLQDAIKEGKQATKAEQKAAKQENNARKDLTKATRKEFKLNKKLASARSKHEKACIDLDNAKEHINLRAEFHQKQISEQQEKIVLIESFRNCLLKLNLY